MKIEQIRRGDETYMWKRKDKVIERERWSWSCNSLAGRAAGQALWRPWGVGLCGVVVVVGVGWDDSCSENHLVKNETPTSFYLQKQQAVVDACSLGSGRVGLLFRESWATPPGEAPTKTRSIFYLHFRVWWIFIFYLLPTSLCHAAL